MTHAEPALDFAKPAQPRRTRHGRGIRLLAVGLLLTAVVALTLSWLGHSGIEVVVDGGQVGGVAAVGAVLLAIAVGVLAALVGLTVALAVVLIVALLLGLAGAFAIGAVLFALSPVLVPLALLMVLAGWLFSRR
ncbi:hypothetical protein [Chitinimonas koreensis]|uniref:hypothetical protein n=1 Tax=Chitinimonas koreensis TaxID=356302 RepID=UPI0003FF1DE7|nr:hypothetical protein [Chitinimonas koreensis]QNM95232.1 hypothetical protein H9L41_15280 [Chitinimonas koreensis]